MNIQLFKHVRVVNSPCKNDVTRWTKLEIKVNNVTKLI